MKSLSTELPRALLLSALLLNMSACATFTASTPPSINPTIPTNNDEAIKWLYIGGPKQLQPGESGIFKLYSETTSPAEIPVEIDAKWSVEPVAGARIDPDSGELTLDNSLSHGSKITVRADIENGRKILTRSVLVYTRDQNPLVGVWVEKEQITCETYTSVPSDPEFGMSIRELIFDADGSFSVTWRPFEKYIDYLGSYEYVRDGGNLTMEVGRGNYIPQEIDLDGSISFNEEGDLVMVDFWLGSPPSEQLPPQCGYVFTRR